VKSLFQQFKLDKPMAMSEDASFRVGDHRVPVEGTLQYRWAKSMGTIKPETRRPIVQNKPVSINDHPSNHTNDHFISTGGTRRMSHKGETK
jgi:hypothetical protein